MHASLRTWLAALDFVGAVAVAVVWAVARESHPYPCTISSIFVACDAPDGRCREQQRLKTYPHFPVHVPALALAAHVFGGLHHLAKRLVPAEPPPWHKGARETLRFLAAALFAVTVAYVCGEHNSLASGFAALLWWRFVSCKALVELLDASAKPCAEAKTSPDAPLRCRGAFGSNLSTRGCPAAKARGEEAEDPDDEEDTQGKAPKALAAAAAARQHVVHEALFCGTSFSLLGWVAVENASTINGVPTLRVVYSFGLLLLVLTRVLVTYACHARVIKAHAKLSELPALMDTLLRLAAAVAAVHVQGPR